MRASCFVRVCVCARICSRLCAGVPVCVCSCEWMNERFCEHLIRHLLSYCHPFSNIRCRSVVHSMPAKEQHDLVYFWTSSPGLPATEVGPIPTCQLAKGTKMGAPATFLGSNACAARSPDARLVPAVTTGARCGSVSLCVDQAGLVPRPSVHVRPPSDGEAGMLPTANTCIARLSIPSYRSRAVSSMQLPDEVLLCVTFHTPA